MTDVEQVLTVTIFTGLSVSGKTLALRFMEDLGFLGIDNLPPALVPRLVELYLEEQEERQLAIAVDLCSSAHIRRFQEALAWLREKGIHHKVIFLEARESVLLERLEEIRGSAKFPQEAEPENLLADERGLLAEIRGLADLVLDTSFLSPAELKERLSITSAGASLQRHISIEIRSFGHKFGPYGADMVFDVRFLPNPYYVPELKPLNGKIARCADFVLRHDSALFFLDTVSDLLEKLAPAYSTQGRARLTVGLGCTGGQHRSVAIAEALGQVLVSRGLAVSVRHRELDTRESHADARPACSSA